MGLYATYSKSDIKRHGYYYEAQLVEAVSIVLIEQDPIEVLSNIL